MRHVTYENPYSVRPGLLVRFYRFVSSPNRNQWSGYAKYILRIFFKRVAFELMKRNVALPFPAYYREIEFTARSTNSQFHSIFLPQFQACYEPDVFAAIECFLPEGGVFVDVGSNWGHHTFIAAIEKGASVYAFEPNPCVYRDLSTISGQLGLDSQVRTFNCAVGNSDSRLELVQTDFESGVASVADVFIAKRLTSVRWPQRLLDVATFKKPVRWTVPSVALDTVIPTSVKVDLIKIDVEGAELECLQGMTETLVNSSAVVVFELHTDATGSLDSFTDFFSSIEYDLYIIDPHVASRTCAISPARNLLPNTRYNILASRLELEDA